MIMRAKPLILCLALALGPVGCARNVAFPGAAGINLSAALYRPDGSGRFPAMVVLHHCGGRSNDVLSWAAWLRGEGYVALAIDSFTPRGIKNCAQGGQPTMSEFAKDAAGALAYLRSLPFVDPKRIGVVGWSYGGGAALIAARAASDWLFDPGPGGFRAAVAFYPNCSQIGADTNIPPAAALRGGR